MKTLKKIGLLLLVLSMVTTSCKKDDDDGPWYELVKLDISREPDYRINILFQVQDDRGIGVAGLESKDFIATEDGKEVTESELLIKPKKQIPIEVKTILLLDNSNSVKEVLDQIKEAAVTLVNNKPDYQKMMVYTFAEDYVQVQDLTADKATLIAAIESITISEQPQTTNLYGALVKASEIDIWDSNYSMTEIRETNLICFTDGDDAADLVTLQDAKTALQDKRVYMLGLGQDLTPDIMKQLGIFYNAEDISKLEEVFLGIQSDIVNTANSYYWLYYDTAKRGDKQYTLRLNVRDNSNGSGFVEALFNPQNMVIE